MGPGHILRLRYYRQQGEPGDSIRTADYKAPDGRDVIALHLGAIDRKGNVDVADVAWKLNDLGWYSGTQLAEHFGEAACKAFGAAVDKKRAG